MAAGDPVEFSTQEMIEYLGYVQRCSALSPRTFWCEFPFYTIISKANQKYCLGYRPADLAHLETIEQKAWEKHVAHLNRLERFPLDKAEYYRRLKESHGVNSVRGLAKITGEDWSCIARILRTLDLAEPIKKYLMSKKDDSFILRFFHLRRLLEIVRQGEEQYQLVLFRNLVEEYNQGML